MRSFRSKKFFDLDGLPRHHHHDIGLNLTPLQLVSRVIGHRSSIIGWCFAPFSPMTSDR